jgi:hypothetical protein
MTILILDESPEKIAEALDDKSLSKMIKSIAQVLLSSHVVNDDGGLSIFNPPCIDLNIMKDICEKHIHSKWGVWVKLCIANYRYLVELGAALCVEFLYRKYCDDCLNTGIIDDIGYLCPYCKGKCMRPNKYHNIIDWCSENEPDLPNKEGGLTFKEYFKDHTCLPSCDGARGYYAGEMSPFPLVMPNRFITEFDQQPDFVSSDILSYRNYYKHLLEKRVKCKACYGFGSHNPGACGDDECCGHRDECDECDGLGTKTITPTWTRRSRPKWL